MQGLVWHPGWLRPQESFWSLLFKVAFASAAEPVSLAEEWLGPNPLLRMNGTLPTEEAAYATCDRMGVARSRAGELFCGFSDGTIEQRRRFNMRLRWCPECAKTWYHTPLFQDWRRYLCPWHGVPLLDQCKVCGSDIDLAKSASWACRCKEPIAPRGRLWPRLFRASVPDVELGGEGAYLHTLPRARSDGAMDVRLLQPSDAPPIRSFDGLPAAEHWRLRAMAFEEASALLEFIVGRHGDCIREEPSDPDLYQDYKPYRYNCPVAAAAAYVAALTSCRTRYQLYFRPRGRNNNPAVDGFLASVTTGAPRWLWRMLIRNMVLSLFASGLELYLDSYRHDRRRIGIWKGPGFRPGTWFLEAPDVAVLKPFFTVSSVLAMVDEADDACPWTHIVPPSKRL